MKKMTYCLVLSLIIVFLAGCATQQYYANAVNSWVGADQERVYHVWGYPDKIQRLPNGHKVLLYRDIEKGRNPVYSTPGSTSVTSNGSGTQVTTTGPTISGGGTYVHKCTTGFELNKKGRVVNTSFRGNNCVATKQFMLSHTYRGF